jgi:two-component system, NarL family, response regulator NreC
MTRTRILVADDLALMRTAVVELLRKSFDVVGAVPNGRAALKSALTLEPDLVVLDVSMPGMNGIDVARELKKRASKARIVFLTAHEDPEIRTACFAAGGLGYVIKGLIGTDLIPAVNEALADRIFVSRSASPKKHARGVA